MSSASFSQSGCGSQARACRTRGRPAASSRLVRILTRRDELGQTQDRLLVWLDQSVGALT